MLSAGIGSEQAWKNSGSRLSLTTHDRLEKCISDVCDFRRRLNFVSEVHVALEEVTRKKPFRIGNIGLWSMIFGERNQLVTDVASWTLGFYSRRGFVRRLEGLDFRALAMKWKGPLDPEIVEVNAAWRRQTFARLFPKSSKTSRGIANKSDVDHLAETLHAFFGPLRVDRHHHRAHRFENRKHASAVAPMLAIDSVEPYVAKCEELLRDFYCLATSGQFSFPSKSRKTSPHSTDVADLLVCGTIRWVSHDMFGHDVLNGAQYGRREKYYDDLHSKHDGLDADAQARRPFNERI